MSTKDELSELATIVFVLYCILGAILTYPCLVIGYYVDELYGTDAGFWAWIISIAVLWLLKMIQAYWLILIIYLVTLVPFIFICIGWYKECYS